MQLLQSIKLNNNSIEAIGDAVFTELKLHAVDLSCNNLSTDNFLWPAGVSIEYLNLTFNAYSSINASVLENISTDLWGESPNPAIPKSFRMPSMTR